jgi:hypothetical protein
LADPDGAAEPLRSDITGGSNDANVTSATISPTNARRAYAGAERTLAVPLRLSCCRHLRPHVSFSVPFRVSRSRRGRADSRCAVSRGAFIFGLERFDAVVNHRAWAFVREASISGCKALCAGSRSRNKPSCVRPGNGRHRIPDARVVGVVQAFCACAVAVRDYTSVILVSPLLGLRSLRTYDFSGAGHAASSIPA